MTTQDPNVVLTERYVGKDLRFGTNHRKRSAKIHAKWPTLSEHTERANKEREDKLPSWTISELLLALQEKGYVFLEEGRWWRTPDMRGNHFGHSYSDSTVMMLPVLRLLDGTSPEEVAIAGTEWLLASEKSLSFAPNLSVET